MMAVDRWTGRHALALQRAMRMTNEQFAAALGVSVRSVAKWHQDLNLIPASFTQQILDAALSHSDTDVRARFDALSAHEADITYTAIQSEGDGCDRNKEILLSALQTGTGATNRQLPDVLAAVAELHERVDDLLTDGTSRRTRLVRLETEVDHHGRDALAIPPIEMICRVGLDLADARHLSRICRTEAERLDIKRAIARLATIAADEMSVLGHVPAARSWYSTAIAAADAAGDISLRADVRALASMLPLYHGNPDEALKLAVEAETLASDRSCLAFGLAPMLQGLAWAKIGDPERAKASLTAARRAHDSTDTSSQAESVFGFSVRRRLFYESRILTLTGDHKSARLFNARLFRCIRHTSSAIPPS